MPRTENQKAVTAYLPCELYNQLSQFKFDENLRSDSQAIAVILERFFFSSASLNQLPENGVQQRIESLEQQFAEFLHQFEGLKLIVFGSTVDSNVPSTVDKLIVICKLYKNNANDPNQWRFWAGFTEGFISNFKLARKYKNEAAVSRQIKAIAESDHAASSRERISWRAYNELLQATATY